MNLIVLFYLDLSAPGALGKKAEDDLQGIAVETEFRKALQDDIHFGFPGGEIQIPRMVKVSLPPDGNGQIRWFFTAH